MTEIKRTQKDRRADSDSRIITAAIECFGSKGFSNATMNEIAKMAGVTSGLLIHRFESKENLFTQAYYTVVNHFFSEATEYLHFPDVFYFFIRKTKEFQKVYFNEFKLLQIVSVGTDLPEFFVTRWRNEFNDRQINKTLLKAQEDGIIAKGDTFNLFNAFFAHLYNELDICDRFNLECPDDEFFMRIFNYSIDDSVKRTKHFMAMLNSIVQTFDSLIHVSFEDGTVEQLKIRENEPSMKTIEEAKAVIEDFINNKIVEAYREEFRKYGNMDDICERLKDKKLVFNRSLSVEGNEVVGCCFPVKRNENNAVTEILAGIQIIGKSED